MRHRTQCANLCFLVATVGSFCSGQTQTPASAPASVPAGATAPLSDAAVSTARAMASAKHPAVSAKQAREADDAYLDGAKHLEHNDLPAAERSFARAVELDPGKQEYVLALAVIREHRVTDLIQRAAKARLMGHDAEADGLVSQAKALDPENSIVTQHLMASATSPAVDPEALAEGTAPSFGPPIELAPTPGKQTIHARGGAQELARAVYGAYGIQVTFDSSLTSGVQGKLVLEDVDFATAARVLAQMEHVLAVPLDAKSALIARDTQDSRMRLQPQVEETIYLPGLSADGMNEMATLARNVFDMQKVSASTASGNLVVRGSEDTLRALNATYADMLDGGTDVVLNVRLYELDKSRTRTIGSQLPTSIGGFSVASEALNLINSNQTLIQQAVANGLLTLTGNPAVDYPKELALLLASGLLSSTQFTNILGTIGTLNGLPLLGVYAGSGATFNLLLNESEARTLDDVQVRATSGQKVNFRSGTKYPIVTATYSSGISSGLASQLSGLKVNGTSVASLLSQVQSSSSVSVPQIQYEDLGVTLVATPKVLRNGDVSMALDLKIEALAGGTINSIPILNSRQMVSGITVHPGQTALLASEISRNESRSIQGIPYLSELPGFQGTDKSVKTDTAELLVTITPQVVRGSDLRIASRRLVVESTQPTGSGPQ